MAFSVNILPLSDFVPGVFIATQSQLGFRPGVQQWLWNRLSACIAGRVTNLRSFQIFACVLFCVVFLIIYIHRE